MARKILKKLNSILETGQEMVRLATTYSDDLQKFDSYNLRQFFNFLKNLEYKADPSGIEALHRPGFVISDSVRYRDCDDKHIALGSHLFRKKIPFRFVAVSNLPNKKIHHVLIQAHFDGKNHILDCTYPHNRFKLFKPITNFHPISGWIRG